MSVRLPIGSEARCPVENRAWPEAALKTTVDHTLMSRFNGSRHECSSPDRFGSKMSGREPCMAGGGAEDDGRSHSDARVGYRRTLVRLGAASVSEGTWWAGNITHTEGSP